MKKRSNSIFHTFETQMGLETRSETLWFRWGFFLLVLYMAFVIFCQTVFFGTTSPIYLMFCILSVIPLCMLGVLAMRRLHITIYSRTVGPKRGAALFLCTTLLTFAVLLVHQLGLWPGSFGNDNITQLLEVYNGEYANWHPVLHTWLFYTLPMLIVPQPWITVTVQLLWFSLAVGYLVYVLYDLGFSRIFAALSWLYIVGNPNTIDLILYPLKDSAMTIFSLVLFTHLIRIYATGGAWLKRKRNLLVFSLFAFLTLGMRHNAVLLVAPVYLILLAFLVPAQKQLAISAAAVLMATALWQGPIIRMAGVKEPDQRTIETMGMPLTILSDIYVSEPESLSEEARQFMDSLATPEEWTHYESGSFNSVKWINGTIIETADSAGIGNILRYTLDGILHAPKSALRGFVNLTHVVWGIENSSGYLIGNEIVSNELNIQEQYQPTIKFAFSSYRAFCNIAATKYLFCFVGTVIAFLLFLAVAQLGGHNLAQVFMVLAPMVYNFGTMLLLTGQDFRFFNMNFAIAVPLTAIILMRKRSPDVQKTC